MLNRRSFFSALSGLPFVGAMFQDKADYPPKEPTIWFDRRVSEHWQLCERRSVDLIESQAKRIAELEAQPRIEWISVNDRLPPESSYSAYSNPVISSYGNGPSSVAQYDHEAKCWVSIEHHGVHWKMTSVTLWAELPKAPQETT